MITLDRSIVQLKLCQKKTHTLHNPILAISRIFQISRKSETPKFLNITPLVGRGVGGATPPSPMISYAGIIELYQIIKLN